MSSTVLQSPLSREVKSEEVKSEEVKSQEVNFQDIVELQNIAESRNLVEPQDLVGSKDVAPQAGAAKQPEATPTNEPRGEKRERASTTSESTVNGITDAPQVKKRKVREVPIWAQPAKHVRKLAKYKQSSDQPSNTSAARMQTPHQASQPMTAFQPVAAPNLGDKGPLGYIEKTVYGDFHPYEDLSKYVCDWLFFKVVNNDTLGTSKVGEAATVEGAFEIEAKIGTIIDKNKHDRLRLPIRTEAVVAEDWDVGFESIMTLKQHAAFNKALNEMADKSYKPPTEWQDMTKPPPPRVGIVYKHKHEVDAFYPLSPSEIQALPPAVQNILKQNGGRRDRQPRVRVTRDQKTGAVLSKIIKARIADLHISCPDTYFDYRVSVNLEANWDGDLASLIRDAELMPAASKDPARYKDRVSYTHQFCQIDLTQVKSTVNSKPESATHELEVELDSTAVKEQGQRILRGEQNQYGDLIRTFLDDVRILVRAGGKKAI